MERQRNPGMTLPLVPMRRMGMQIGMRRIHCPVEFADHVFMNGMQRIRDGFPCGAWEPEEKTASPFKPRVDF
jgi:hypothetical protein